MTINWKRNNQVGSSLLETLIAVAIFGILLVGFVSVLTSLAVVEISSQARSEASLLARESIEIGYNLATTDWDDFSANFKGQYFPSLKSDGTLTLTSGIETIKSSRDFERYLLIEDVYRNAAGEFVDASFGTLDPEYLKLVSLVTWGDADEHETIRYELTLTNLAEFETVVSDL